MKKKLLLLLITSLAVTFQLRAQTLIPISEGINPYGSSEPNQLLKLQDHLYLFTATNPSIGVELYATDGSQAGTFLLKDINPGVGNSFINSFTRINDTVCIFEANDGSTNHGSEVWRSNGTPSGTYMVEDLTPGPSSTNFNISNAVLNNKTFFTTYANGIGALYITDGDSLGTTQLLSGYNGDYQQSGAVVAVANDIAYFFIPEDPDYDLHLWRTDGTIGGTFELMDLNMTLFNPRLASALNGMFIFSASDSIHGRELWITDGTVAGTTMIKDLIVGSSGSDPNSPLSLNNKIIFTASLPPNQAIWATDGTSTGTYPLGDSTVFPVATDFWYVGRADSNFYFEANDYNNGDSILLW
ncbi:MAG TPA: hypothetical protein VE978_25870, partial [Chitinophagales bacterium]|nr:hypothetical protein [Chitinophagales bacterium]